MSVHEAVAEPVGACAEAVDGSSTASSDQDFGAELSDEELDELLVREITIDGMCGVY